MPSLVFLETSDIGARYCAEASRALGFDPLFFCDLARYQADPRAQLLSVPHVEVDTSSLAEVLRAARSAGIDGEAALVTLVDSRLVVACLASRALGVRGLDPAVVALKSKAHVARLVRDLGPPSVAFRQGEVPRAELERLLEHTGRLIVKPDTGAGGAGIFLVESARELETVDATIARRRRPDNPSGDFLAQVFVEGALVSLEGYVLRGELHPIGFTDRKKIGATECEASFPVDETLSSRAREAALRVCSELFRQSAFANGYFHVELIVQGDSASLIDANVGRLGGGPMGELLAFAHGLDPVEVYRHFLEVTLLHATRDSAPSPYAGRTARRASSVLYGLRDGGTLLDVELPDDPRTRHTRLLGPGAEVTPMGTDDWSWIGILTGLDDDTLRVRDSIRIRTTHGLELPCPSARLSKKT